MALTFRRNIGDEQYFSDRRNLWMRQNIDNIIRQHEDFIYVSAHEYSQQLFKTASLGVMQRYLISGTAARSEYVAPGHKNWFMKPYFVSSDQGFASLNFYKDGSIWVDFWGVSDDGSGKLLYDIRIRPPKIAVDQPRSFFVENDLPDYRDSTITVSPEPDYKAGWLQEFLMGSNHRDAWITPVEVPYIDIGKEHGGLRPVKRGGGQQTISIRLEAADIDTFGSC
jgi:hypothetical protein